MQFFYSSSPLFRLFAGATLIYGGAVCGDTVQNNIGPVSPAASDSGAIAWKQGVQLVKSGHILNGIKLLDSLRVSGYSGNDFLKDYCLTVFHALVPENVDTTPRISKHFISTFSDTLDPSSHEWNVIRFSDPGGKTSLPCFTYGATFDLRKPFRLVFSGLRQSNLTVMQMGYVANHAPANSMASQLLDRKERAVCRLFIDLNASGSPALDYLSKRISGVYDSIAFKPELQACRGLSLRCYTVSHFADEEGKYTAIASFDRTLPDITRGRPASAEKRPGTIRYTLVVQACYDVKDMLEAKFQSLLREFL
jgi:hypothetical protein